MKQKHKRKLREQLRQAENLPDWIKLRLQAKYFNALERKQRIPLFIDFRRPCCAA